MSRRFYSPASSPSDAAAAAAGAIRRRCLSSAFDDGGGAWILHNHHVDEKMLQMQASREKNIGRCTRVRLSDCTRT